MIRHGRATNLLCATLGFACMVGCQAPQAHPDPRGPAVNAVEPATNAGDYTIVFPDHITIDVPTKPEWSGRFFVPPDGRITFPDGGTLLLEGASIDQVRTRVAELSRVPRERITCAVSHPRSRVVYLLGSVNGEPRAIPYTGPERLVDLLQRTGGLAPSADRNAITVTRRNVAHGQQAQTYHIDLAAIAQGDQRSNIILEPNDEIVVGKQEPASIFRTVSMLFGR